jgi:hypothetical protein
VLLTLGLVLGATGVLAEEVLQELSWSSLQQAGRIAAGAVLPPDGGRPFHRLRVETPPGQPALVRVLTIERPAITRSRYAITGLVRYEAVGKTGYLEMWNFFPGGGQYFSRTLAETGPLRWLEGTSDWRPFVLPFFNANNAPAPTRLTFGVTLPAGGRVDLGPLRLVQYDSGEDPLASADQWWGDRTAGLVGGGAGGVVGILGALVGWLGGTGRARRFVLGLTGVLIGAGVVAFVAGAIAWTRGQPYAVYYPLLLVGFICAVVFGSVLPTLRKRYEAQELRRMRALDVR